MTVVGWDSPTGWDALAIEGVELVHGSIEDAVRKHGPFKCALLRRPVPSPA
jgi:hypothetical protein